MARNQIGLTRFYADVLGARLANYRWSWGAVDPINNRVFLRVWEDHMEPPKRPKRVLVLRPEPTSESPGYREREAHLALIQQGASGFGVVCVPRYTYEGAPREIINYNDQELLVLGRTWTDPTGVTQRSSGECRLRN